MIKIFSFVAIAIISLQVCGMNIVSVSESVSERYTSYSGLLENGTHVSAHKDNKTGYVYCSGTTKYSHEEEYMGPYWFKKLADAHSEKLKNLYSKHDKE